MTSSLWFFFFFLNDPATPKTYPLPLPAALPTYPPRPRPAQPLLQPDAQSRRIGAPAPPLAPGTRLDPIAAQERDLRFPGHAEVPEPRHAREIGRAHV